MGVPWHFGYGVADTRLNFNVSTQRLSHLDAVKVIASQLIVLHHFSVYGPLADALHHSLPDFAGWLFEYARMVVQFFLVMGGYFAAKSLAPMGQWQPKSLGRAVFQRWLRLVGPFAFALLLTVIASALARPWLEADFISPPPSIAQIIAHLSLSFGPLEVDSLSAGAWYVAIDFQLYALLALLLWLGNRWGVACTRYLVVVCLLTSLLVFNRHAEWDVWALYFFAAYGLGALAWWAQNQQLSQAWRWGVVVAVLAALAWDFRIRIALAAGFALWLALPHARWPDALAQPLHLLGRSSYALFLTHFSVLTLANAAWAHWQWHFDGAALALLLGAWLACNGLAVLFERWIETWLGRTIKL